LEFYGKCSYPHFLRSDNLGSKMKKNEGGKGEGISSADTPLS
jgi:hypothetical protein